MGTILIRCIQIGSIILGSIFSILLVKDAKKNKDRISKANPLALGAVTGGTMFFDALGIGAYAPQTALFKIFKLVPDRLIPGTLNTCSIIPCVLEAVLFITLIKVDPLTLIVLIASCALGARLGARIVGKLPEKKIQVILGIALLVVGVIMILRQFGLFPSGGNAIGLYGWKLPFAAVVIFGLGLCTACGIGAYAPMMALLYSLGMNPRSAFPVLFGAYTFLMPISGFRFLKDGSYDIKTTLIGQIGGSIGVLLAVFLVKEIPLTILNWIVICVLFYTSVTMFYSVYKTKKKEAAEKLNVQENTTIES